MFITSDHNELTGQNGLFCHIALVAEGADVQIILYTKNANYKIVSELMIPLCQHIMNCGF